LEVATKKFGEKIIKENGLIRSKYASRKNSDKLVNKKDIQEQIVLIKGSNTDYIASSGVVYAEYDNNMYYPKYPFENKHNHYMYVNVMFSDGKIKSRRVHVLLAKAFLFNPNPKKFKIVGHKDNNKNNNDLSNLYWTTNQENTQKAVDDGLNIAKRAENNSQSTPLKVMDKNTLEVIGIYGSLRECGRCIENITLSTISKVYKLDNYKPRSRKYIYKAISTEEFNSYSKNLISVHLIENPKVNKNPKVFRMVNKKLKFDSIMDNQVTASKICGIYQSDISQYLLSGDKSEHNGWSFELISETTRKESSAYQNHLATVDSITIQNIHDNRILEFKSGKELKDYFKLKGHDLMHYIKTNQLLMSEWKIIDKREKTGINVNIA
jgi:hypothetical protein